MNEVSSSPIPKVGIGDIFLGELHDGAHGAWNVDVLVDGKPVRFKLDSGADVTAIPEAQFETLFDKKVLQKPDRRLFGPCKYELRSVGKFQTRLQLLDASCTEEIYVVQDLENPLLGRNACSQLETLKQVNNVSSKEVPDPESKYTHLFPDVFTGLGCLDGTYDIAIDPKVEPFNLTTPCRIPIPMLPKVKEELEKMEKLGVIEKVDQPTAWCSPMVVVPKPGNQVRICGDFVQLNKAVLREVYPMPTTEETLAKLSGVNFVTKRDANAGF